MFHPLSCPQGPLGTFPSPLRGPWECWASIGTPQSVLWMSRGRTPHPQVVAETLLALRSRHSVTIGWWAPPRSGALRKEDLGSEAENPTLAFFFSEIMFPKFVWVYFWWIHRNRNGSGTTSGGLYPARHSARIDSRYLEVLSMQLER